MKASIIWNVLAHTMNVILNSQRNVRLLVLAPTWMSVINYFPIIPIPMNGSIGYENGYIKKNIKKKL